MKPVLMTVCLLLAASLAKAEEPPWMRGEFPPQSNDTYFFKVTFGEGDTHTKARTGAIIALVNELARNQGVTVKGSDIIKTIMQQDNERYTEQNISQTIYRIETDKFNARFELADLYFDDNVCWALFEVARNPKRRTAFDRIEYTEDYKGEALWRSILMPGWGQIHKRSTAKGITIFALEAISIAGVFACNDLSNSYYNKALSENNMSVREQYVDRSTTFRNIRNGFIVAAGAVYAYNLIDAISSKGARRYKATVSPNGLSFIINL
jgi:hypothetical protein